MQVAERGATVTDGHVAGHGCNLVVRFEFDAADGAEAVEANMSLQLMVGLGKKRFSIFISFDSLT